MALLTTAFGLVAPKAHAANAAGSGSIEGNVLNLSSGQYLNLAVVRVEGSGTQTFTNESGEYKIVNLAPGTYNIVVSYTGQEPKVIAVKVEAGKTTKQDFGLNTGATVKDDGTLVLDPYRVNEQRFANAQEIAVNEERRSVNAKDVVASDSLGYIAGGNVGEFVKYIPGVQTEYGSADSFAGANLGGVNPSAASQVAIRGFGSADTAIKIDGVAVSGVGPTSLTNAVGLDMLSINNASRIEIIKVPTPEMGADAVGGTVNLVTKSAFEYARPTYSVEISAIHNSLDRKYFGKSAGPANKNTNHMLPSAAISVAIPINKNLGISVSASIANSYSPNFKTQAAWQMTNSTTYGSTSATVSTVVQNPTVIPIPAFPATFWSNAVTRRTVNTTYGAYNTAAWTTTSTGTRTGATFTGVGTLVSTITLTVTQTGTIYYNVGNIDNGLLSDITNPFLKTATDEQNPWSETRESFSLKADWKPIKGMLVTASYTGSTYEGINVDRRLQVTAYGPMRWGSDYSIGRPSYGNQLNEEVTSIDKSGITHTGYLKISYKNGPWSFDALGSISKTNMDLDDLKNGHLYKVVMKSSVNQVTMSGITDGTMNSRGQVGVYDATGAPVDWTKPRNWTLDQVDVGSGKSQQQSKEDEYSGSLKRQLDFLPFDMAIKVGAKRSTKDQSKSGLGTGQKIRYTGDTSAAFLDSITDTTFNRGNGIGFAKNMQWADPYRFYDIYIKRPDLFNENYNVTYTANNYHNLLNSDKRIELTKDSYFAQLEGTFFNHRLSVVGGFTQGRNTLKGFQAIIKGSINFLKNPDGTIYRDGFYPFGVRFDGGDNTRNDTLLRAEIPATSVSPTFPAIWAQTVFKTTQIGGAALSGTFNTANVDLNSNFYTDTALMTRLAAAGVTVPTGLWINQLPSTNSVTGTSANNMDAARASHYRTSLSAKQTNPVIPMISASYNITEKLVFKPSWARGTQMPALDAGNGGTAGILGGYNISEKNQPDGSDGGDGTITVPNPNLKPKLVDSWNFQLAYYTKQGGKFGATYWYKTIKNEWITDNYTPLNGEEYTNKLRELGLDPDVFRNWTIATTDNGNETSHSSGYDFEARQSLGFLGELGSHFNFFGNYSHKVIKQSNRAGVVAMPSFNNNTWTAGGNMSFSRVSFTAKVIFQNELWVKNGTVGYTDASGIEYKDQLYKVYPKNYNLKLDLSFMASSNITLFMSGDNVTNTFRKDRQADAMGLLPDYAKTIQMQQFGISVAAGIRATF